MPRSLKGEIKNYIKKQLEKEKNERLEIANKAINDVIQEEIELTFDDCNRLYDFAIEQFYSYPTHVYKRYGVGKGTGTGERLYYANKITKDDSHISVKIDGDYLDYNMPYSDKSANVVLGNVMSGIRYYRPTYINEDGEFVPEFIMRWSLNKGIKTSRNWVKESNINDLFYEYRDRWNRTVNSRVEKKVKQQIKIYAMNRR